MNSWSRNSPVLSVALNPLQPLGFFRLMGSGSVGPFFVTGRASPLEKVVSGSNVILS